MSEMPPEEYMLDSDRVKELLIKKRLLQMSRKKKLIWSGALLFLASLAISFYIWHSSNSQAGFLTSPVTRSTITDNIEATGTLEPIMKSEMGFKNDGAIILLNVQPGDRVKKGQVLAKQDASNLKAVLEQAQSTLIQDEINLQSLILNLESNRKTLEQQERLFEAGVSSELERDTARKNLLKSELEKAAAEAKLITDRAKVEQAKSDLSEATLIAPFDGIIGQVNGQVGQLNGINSNSSTLLTVMSEDLQLAALVNEADIGRIKVGQEVEFTSSAFSDKVFKGKVLRITPEAQTVSNVQYYPVLISCLDPEHQLYSGMSVSARIIVVRKKDVLTIPMMAVSYAATYIRDHREELGLTSPAAIGRRPTDSRANPANRSSELGQSGTVLVLENGKPTMRRVSLGLSNGSSYEVLDGLQEGEQVIVGSNQLDASASSNGSNSGSGNTRSGRDSQRGMMQGPPRGF